MKVDYSSKFLKQSKKAPAYIRAQIIKRIELFLVDPFHKTLNNHPLTGKLKNYHSINISGDWRLMYKPLGKQHILIIAIGTHSQLYG